MKLWRKQRTVLRLLLPLTGNDASVNSLSEESGWHFFLYKPQSVIDSTVSQILISEDSADLYLCRIDPGTGTFFFKALYPEDRRTYREYGTR